MKRTHKLKVLGDVAGVVAAAPNLSVAAKRLGVNRSTLHRWLQAGKVQKAAPKTGPAAGAMENQAPEEWAKAVRAMGELDVTQSALVDLAEAALRMARTEVQPTTRLSAMGRYQQLVRQLNLASERVVVSEVPAVNQRVPLVQRRAGVDPRSVLMAVK